MIQMYRSERPLRGFTSVGAPMLHAAGSRGVARSPRHRLWPRDQPDHRRGRDLARDWFVYYLRGGTWAKAQPDPAIISSIAIQSGADGSKAFAGIRKDQ